MRPRTLVTRPTYSGLCATGRRTLLDVARDEPSWLPVACAGCEQRWYGIDRAHCANCHRTFTDADLFDRHRVDHECRNPVSLNMIKHAKSGVWEPRPTTIKPRCAS